MVVGHDIIAVHVSGSSRLLAFRHALQQPTPSSSELDASELQTVNIFKQATPSVVNIANIATARTRFSTDVMKVVAMGWC